MGALGDKFIKALEILVILALLKLYIISPHILLRNASYAAGMLHGALHRFIAHRAVSSKFGYEFRLLSRMEGKHGKGKRYPNINLEKMFIFLEVYITLLVKSY